MSLLLWLRIALVLLLIVLNTLVHALPLLAVGVVKAVLLTPLPAVADSRPACERLLREILAPVRLSSGVTVQVGSSFSAAEDSTSDWIAARLSSVCSGRDASSRSMRCCR